MPRFKGKFRIESTRLPWWDYTTAGWYFMTVCTQRRKCFFGEVEGKSVRLSPIGGIVAEEWKRTEHIRPNVFLDEWVIMPNHLHGILIIQPQRETAPRETFHRDVSTGKNACALKANSLGSIIGQFKSVSTKRIRAAGFSDFAWQPRFYEHIIRNEQSLADIRQYMADNPVKWETDKDNPTFL